MAQEPYGSQSDWRDRDERDRSDEGRRRSEDRSFAGSRPYAPAGRTYGGETRYGDYGAYDADRYSRPDYDRGPSGARYGRDRGSAYGEDDASVAYDDTRRSSSTYWPYGSPADRDAQRRFKAGPQQPAGRGFWDRTMDRVESWLAGDEIGPGEHRGKGPKGYRRSDDRLRDDVSDRLMDDAWLDASDIEVKVKDGEVTLSGTVPRRDDRRRAEMLAEMVSGVGHVQNDLRVQPDVVLGSPS